MAKLAIETLKNLVRSIAATRPVEIGCETCLDQLEIFVEQELEGKDAAQALPLIKQHLDGCTGCGEEYEALLDALRSIEAPAV